MDCPYALVSAVVQNVELPPSPTWFEQIRAAMAGSGIVLANGCIEIDGVEEGSYRVLSPREVAADFPSASWLAPTACPFLRGPVGFVGWQVNLPNTRYRFAGTLLTHARGAVARVRDGRFWQPVQLREFSMREVTLRHGFGDGDDLLGRERAYLDAVRLEAQRVMAAAGFAGDVGVKETTHHNPILLWSRLERGGREVPEDELGALSIRIWAIDRSVLDDDDFWQD